MLCTNKQMKKTHTEHGSCLFLFACHPCATDVCFVYTFLLHFQLHFFVVVVAAAALFCSVCSISIDSGKREREKKRIYSRLLDEFNSSRYPDHVKVSMQTERKTEKKFPWKKQSHQYIIRCTQIQIISQYHKALQALDGVCWLVKALKNENTEPTRNQSNGSFENIRHNTNMLRQVLLSQSKRSELNVVVVCNSDRLIHLSGRESDRVRSRHRTPAHHMCVHTFDDAFACAYSLHAEMSEEVITFAS